MKLISILKTKKYGIIALIASFLMLAAYPYLQVILNGGFYNYFFWFEVIIGTSILNFMLYITFSILFGLVTSLIIYNWQHRTCSIKKSLGSGSLGSLLAIFTSQCSACLSLGTLFLPAAAVTSLSIYSTLFNFISIGALLLSIYLMGGFKS